MTEEILKEEIELGAFWLEQKTKTLRDCLQHLLGFLVTLKEYQPQFFSDLYALKETEEEMQSKKIAYNYDALKRCLTDGTIKDDSVSYTGFLFELCNKETDAKALDITAVLGGQGDLDDGYFNGVMIDIPLEGEMYEYYKEEDKREGLIGVLVDYWNPDFFEVNDEVREWNW